MTANRPFGRLISYAEAVDLSEKSLRTIQRWVENDHVRTTATEDGWMLSELDIVAMTGRRWTRTPRLRHTA